VQVIDKPAGVPYQATSSNFRECVVQALAEARGKKLWGLHRLDLEVSGCLAFAKTPSAAKRFHQALNMRQGGAGAGMFVRKVFLKVCVTVDSQRHPARCAKVSACFLNFFSLCFLMPRIAR
jgi:23S rRNA-/tRNA-specific pseudouridylate synthase